MTEGEHLSDRVEIGLGNEFFPISPGERDRNLLASPWPQGATADLLGDSAWSDDGDGLLIRHVLIFNEDSPEPSKEDSPKPSKGGSPALPTTSGPNNFWEALLRFPNAPVYATHKPRPPFYRFPKPWPNFHTMRILGVGDRPPERVRRVYLLHNGLNETRDMLFHYRLAAWILNRRPDAVCIIRPLPGHLTRYPFHGPFNETPLDSYLRNPMDLFRQFLRYMIETQWLLSIIAPRSYYSLVGGGRLLPSVAPDDQAAVVSDGELGEVIAGEWKLMMDRSNKEAHRLGLPPFSRMEVTKDEVTEIVTTLRNLLGWKSAKAAPRRVSDTNASPELAEYPYVHVVGYSMGGFMAQACFFGWPQVICSCTNLFAGGALRDLAPTAFANPEEWQAVLHALRYEFDSALTKGSLTPRTDDGQRLAERLAAVHLAAEPAEQTLDHPAAKHVFTEQAAEHVAGIAAGDFEYMKRIFYEVYLQYYRGGYSSRVAEFSRRLLFVVGGDDPIVRTESVLDAGPPEGMTLLQLADVSHFPGGATWKEDDLQQIEREQRTYWLPEVGRMISRYSVRTEVALHNTRVECWDGAYSPENNAAKAKARGARPAAAADGLDNRTFERELDALLDIVAASPRGWLLVSRNEIPPVFLGEEGYRCHARALHHAEGLIARYSHSLASREARLRTLVRRMTLLIPRQSPEWFLDPDLRRKLFARSETSGAGATREELERMLDHFRRQWARTSAVRAVTASESGKRELKSLGVIELRELKTNKLALTMLPDVWIGFASEACGHLCGTHRKRREDYEQGMVEFAKRLAEKRKTQVKWAEEWLRDDKLIVLKVSAAEFNPRYRGHRLREPEAAIRALLYWALAYDASDRIKL